MKRTKSLVWGACGVIPLLVFAELSTAAQSSSIGWVWNYILLPGSELVDSCPVCGRPDIVVALRGTFQLRLTDQNPLVFSYEVQNLVGEGGFPGGAHYTARGGGLYQIGGEVALTQNVFLEVSINDGLTNTLGYFTNNERAVTRLWPMMEISVDQTNGTMLQQYRLKLVAAPLREIWFSTLNSFHNSLWQPPTNYVSAGDLLSSSGRVVKRNQDLTRNLGIMPVVPDLGLKDIDILPGGEVAFSAEQDIFSETLGSLSTGDVLSDRGHVLVTNSALIAAFAPQPPVGEMGLKALQVLDTGEIYFSVQTNFYSENLEQEVRHGDLLSNRGLVVRRNEDLLARFQPVDPKKDYGLRSVYVWPSGEIWFSTETGFSDTNLTFYLAGDLLSDQGYVVYRNLDLVSAFAPLEDLANFGLDALFVVTDVTASPPAPQCVEVGVAPGTDDLSLRFSGRGRVFQLEKSANLVGPWEPLSPIGPDLNFVDTGALQKQAQAFYRLRAW